MEYIICMGIGIFLMFMYNKHMNHGIISTKLFSTKSYLYSVSDLITKKGDIIDIQIHRLNGKQYSIYFNNRQYVSSWISGDTYYFDSHIIEQILAEFTNYHPDVSFSISVDER